MIDGPRRSNMSLRHPLDATETVKGTMCAATPPGRATIPSRFHEHKMRSKLQAKRSQFDELYVLRLDSAGRARGARFGRLEDNLASAAVDMKCRTLLLPPATVCVIGMELPEGRLYRGRLVMPRIQRRIYNKILEAAQIAARQESTRAKDTALKQSAYIKALIAEANSAIAERRKMRRVRR